MTRSIIVVAAVIGAIAIYTQLCLFVIQPIGIIPEGATLVIPRGAGLNFVDSEDALCAREFGGVNLMCRGIVLAAMAERNSVILRLPYSQTLYEISTGGKVYADARLSR